MFADALEKAKHFTKPFVISRYMVGKKCSSIVGTCVIINDEGWFLTAAHIMKIVKDTKDAVVAYQNRAANEAAIRNDSTVDEKERRRRLRAMGRLADDDPTAFSVWGGQDGMGVAEAKVNPHIDLAIGRFEPFDKNWVKVYPTFWDPSHELRMGTSLCSVGFPFPNMNSSYDESQNRFAFDVQGRLAMFPIEGIFTREVIDLDSTGNTTKLFIERSAPGLMGQSGGPILDRNGTVWGIQSRTSHLSLGFDPPVPGGKQSQKVHQFLNAGWAVHPEQVKKLLDQSGVKYALEH